MNQAQETSNPFALVLGYYERYRKVKLDAESLKKIAKKYKAKPDSLLQDLVNKYEHPIAMVMPLAQLHRLVSLYDVPKEYLALLPSPNTFVVQKVAIPPTSILAEAMALAASSSSKSDSSSSSSSDSSSSSSSDTSLDKSEEQAAAAAAAAAAIVLILNTPAADEAAPLESWKYDACLDINSKSFSGDKAMAIGRLIAPKTPTVCAIFIYFENTILLIDAHSTYSHILRSIFSIIFTYTHTHTHQGLSIRQHYKAQALDLSGCSHFRASRQVRTAAERNCLCTAQHFPLAR